jgi:hypothetical protein
VNASRSGPSVQGTRSPVTLSEGRRIRKGLENTLDIERVMTGSCRSLEVVRGSHRVMVIPCSGSDYERY